MVHVHLRLLEKYAQQHEHMYIRSRRRAARKRKEKAQQNPDDPEAAAAAAAEVDAAEDAESMARESKQVSTERAFDFERFEHKFMHPKCIHSFVSFLGMYKELDSNQIMRSIKFLHRVVEKRKLDILLCRIDYVDLFYNLMQGPEPLPKSNPAYKPTDEFVKHFFRKLFKKLQKMPVLYVEVCLHSSVPAIATSY